MLAIVFVWSYHKPVPLTKPENTNPPKKMNSSLWFGGSQAPFHRAHTSAVTGTRTKWMKEARWPLQVAVWFYIGSASLWKLPMSEILEKEESLVKFTLQNQIINGQSGVSPLKYWTLLSEDT